MDLSICRFLYTLKQKVGNKAQVEASICEAYIAEETSMFCSHYFEPGKANRASSTGGTQHKGGSIPNFEHKRRMAEHLGREPSVFELFKKTHYNEKTREFADHRVDTTHDWSFSKDEEHFIGQ
ncbi:hypothetical protein K1719_030204 [Acacia pycnantha]|nr:hypothetical protein K1719_030204 [Acacia pycnantha]